MLKENIAVDFDGVLNEYEGYVEGELYEPKPFAKQFLKALSDYYNVIIFTSRDTAQVIRWLQKYRLDEYVTNVTGLKPPAVAYIDDRAIRFNGDYEEVLAQVDDNIDPYWLKDSESDESEETIFKFGKGYWHGGNYGEFPMVVEEFMTRIISDGKLFPESYLMKIDEIIEDLEDIKKIIVLDAYKKGALRFTSRGEKTCCNETTKDKD